MNAKNKLIIALDFPTMEKAVELVEKLGDEATFYKVGLELFLNSKGEMIEYLNNKNKKIFLDLKFHDIPNTTAMASVFAAKKDVFMFNVHATGGKKMMTKVVEEVRKINNSSLLIAVTILTSFSEEEIQETFQTKANIQELAMNLANLTKESGMNGIVCSPWEANSIKKSLGEEFKTVCPGVRPLWAATNDQKRIMTPKKAILNGCDFLVVGRPITKNEDPIKAVQLILKEIEEGIVEKNN
ncbi:MAG: orotidine-5'-phosphate decarboxylase [Fusobacterium sp. JB021]|nr:orotidine-5'-phosphate decarboxylase [Fusobacterium sp. JB020]MDP0494335.1 orotidine-5'-phosphate decarboxylase [Fusobacterium sp. JB021]MDP0506296.1 orotidine-5'-phosphate decarboxylase [Fusobacterium sp. JB019]